MWTHIASPCKKDLNEFVIPLVVLQNPLDKFCCSSCLWGGVPSHCEMVLMLFFFHPQVLSPTYKQRNEDFRKLFKKLPDTERLIVGELSMKELRQLEKRNLLNG